jgi:hypothetical protein
MNTCTTPATFGVIKSYEQLAACPAHLPDAVGDGARVVPLDSDYPCQVPRKRPFGFSKETE